MVKMKKSLYKTKVQFKEGCNSGTEDLMSSMGIKLFLL